MKKENEGPIIGSRFEHGQQSDNNDGLIKFLVALIIMMGVMFWIFQDLQPTQEEFDLTEEAYAIDEVEETYSDQVAELPVEVVQEEENIIEEEEQTVDFFYKRALQREGDKDFQGAVDDYAKTIELAKKYSAEMWNSLNNGGIIKAQQFKDYRSALKDFNRIIKIETNRYDGEINDTRLEAGYTNRAYVKKMKGDTDGACDDLYEALSLGVEGSVAFIEKQIDKNCL